METTTLWCQAPGLWLPGPVRRILQLKGYDPRPAIGPLGAKAGDWVGIWGRSPLADGAEKLAQQSQARILRMEDAFLRSLAPGRSKRRDNGPLGLMLDDTGGVHFDPRAPSALEHILRHHPLDDTGLLDRAREGILRLRQGRLSKYNLHDPECAPPPAGYVLVVDQTQGDASLKASGATYGLMREMLFRAQEEHPHHRILIRAHPETLQGLREGHFTAADASGLISFIDSPIAPQDLLEGAIAVYTVSSQLGFEAILAGHRPHVFGSPFYAGWGLTHDHGGPLPRRHRSLTPAQLFAAAMILAPTWYDPCRDQLCSFEVALDHLEAQVRAYRQDRHGHIATGMRLWKRRPLQQFFGREQPLRFVDPPARALALGDKPPLVWAGLSPPDAKALRVEDGLIRSRGLGADLVPPLSLVVDDRGIYYDPNRPSLLEELIPRPLRAAQSARAERLVATLNRLGVTKYNLGGKIPDLPSGHRILVPGQVEDDASLTLGGGAVRRNLDLLRAVRAAHPSAVILWKPHPDVEAGLRPGRVSDSDLRGLANVTLREADAAAAIMACDEVWTMTSGLGFEALLRAKPVTCLGMPFYAGWGLTRDVTDRPVRRQARPDLLQLVHATLIDYPRYRDPITGRPCPVEVVVERIASGRVLPRSVTLRLLAKAQGALAGQAHLWRRTRQ